MNSHALSCHHRIVSLNHSNWSRHPLHHKVFVLLAVFAAVAGAIGLSSCAGYTSASGTQSASPGSGVLTASSTSLSLGNVSVGSNASQSLTLTNTGTAKVNISQATISGAGFTIVGENRSSSIPAGQRTTVQVQFAPQSAGAAAGSLTVTSDASNSPLTISLSGTGVAAAYSLSANPTSLTFGNISVGNNSSLNVTLTNNGNLNITISGVTETGAGFSTSGVSSGMTLTPSQTATLTVTFTPTTSGSASGSVRVSSNATNSPAVMSLSGSSYYVALTWTASSSTDVASYNVYRGTALGAYTRINTSPVTTTQYSDPTVDANVTYYYVVTAVDSNGAESTDSSPATASIP